MSGSRLVDGYVSGLISESVYKQKKLETENAKVILNSQIAEIQAKGGVDQVTLEQIKNIFIDCNKAAEKYLAVDDIEKRNMLKKLLSNASIQNKNVAQYSFKSIYMPIALAPKNLTLSEMRATQVKYQRSETL